MRGLFVASEPLVPPVNGVRRKSFELRRALADIVELDVVFYSEKPPRAPDGGDVLPSRRAPRLRIAASTFLPRQRFLAEYPDEWVEARIAAAKYDFVHLDSVRLGHLAKPISKANPGTKLIWSINDSYSLFLKTTKARGLARLVQPLRAGSAARYEAGVAQQVSFVDVVDTHDVRHLEAVGLTNTFEIPLGLSGERGRVVPRAQHLTIGIMSSLEADHGASVADFVAHARPILQRTGVKLSIIGSGRWAATVRAVGEDSLVTLRPHVKSPAEFLSAIDVAVVPLQRRGGTPTKALEALAAGVPVVGGAAVAGVAERVPSAGVQVCSTSAQMALEATRLALDPAGLERARSMALTVWDHWPTWADVARRYVSRL